MRTKRITSEELAAIPGVTGEWIARLEAQHRDIVGSGKLYWHKVTNGAQANAPTKEEAVAKLIEKVKAWTGDWTLNSIRKAKGLRVTTTFVPEHPKFAPDGAGTKWALEFKEGLK